MKRQEFLLNLTLLVIIGVLVYLIYESRDLPRGLDELAVPLAAGKTTTGTLSTATVPETETGYAAKDNGSGGDFGEKNIFRALLTPTPTPPPPTPTPPPTPDIKKSLGAWKLLSIYQGKALMEDVQISAQNGEGAIWEMSLGDKKQVDVGNSIMKTVTLKAINNENPYSPEVTFTMEDTNDDRKINLDTEPTAAAPAPAPKKQ